MNALEAHRLGKRYGEEWALRDCSLVVPAGRVVGLVGPNGAGKTTLLQLAVGLLSPSSGRIELFGAAPGTSRESLARVGFVAQEAPLYDDFRVAEILTIGRRLNRRWDQAWAEQRLAGLSIPLAKRIGQLSGGQRAQVALALALGKRPELLLLDEPVVRLDPLARREFLQSLMEAAAERGLTVVLSSHLISDLERSCDFLILLRDSEVRLSGEIDELLADHRLLIGPQGRSTAGTGIGHVIRESHTDKQATLLAQISGPIADPAWEAHPVDLEELVLAYLGQPTQPQLRAVTEQPTEAHA
jgi:ABC-2 type transport system ATP-binding protein